PRRAVWPLDDILDPNAGLAQLRFAMPLQDLAPLIGADRHLQASFALLQLLDDHFEFRQGILERHRANVCMRIGCAHSVISHMSRSPLISQAIGYLARRIVGAKGNKSVALLSLNRMDGRYCM